MRKNALRGSLACAVGLSLAFGATLPALAEEEPVGFELTAQAAEGVADSTPAAQADGAGGDAELEAQAERVECLYGEAIPIRIGQTVKGTVGKDETTYAVTTDSLTPDVDAMVDITLKVTKYGEATGSYSDKAYVSARLELPPIMIGSYSPDYVVCEEAARDVDVMPSASLDPAKLKEADERILTIGTSYSGRAYYVIGVEGTAGSTYELSIQPVDVPRYHMDSFSNTGIRLWGDNALVTMQAALREDPMVSWYWSDAVVLATAGDYYDALAAAGLAGLHRCPVLVTDGQQLSVQTRAEIRRLSPKRVYIAGGPLAVSEAVEREVVGLGPSVTRVYGQNAIDTAVAIYKEGKKSGEDAWGSTAIVATSTGYYDALSIAPYSWGMHAPIFLTGEGNVLTNATLDAIKQGGFTRVVIVGGKLVVSESVEGQLASAGISDVVRLAGPNAIDTSAAIATWEAKNGMEYVNTLTVATTEGYLDALCGAPVAGRHVSPLVLLDKEGKNLTAVDAGLAVAKADSPRILVLGGTLAISAEAQDAIAGRMK